MTRGNPISDMCIRGNRRQPPQWNGIFRTWNASPLPYYTLGRRSGLSYNGGHLGLYTSLFGRQQLILRRKSLVLNVVTPLARGVQGPFRKPLMAAPRPKFKYPEQIHDGCQYLSDDE